MSTYDDASLILIPSGVKDGKVYSAKPTNGDGDFTFTRASEATRLVDGVVTKVRTNSLKMSNTLDNYRWTHPDPTTTVLGGQTDRSGGSTAWKITKTAAWDRIDQSLSPTVLGITTLSVYAKKGATDWMYFRADEVTYIYEASFDLATGAVGATANLISSSISDAGGGWWRCSLTFNATGAGASVVRMYPSNADTSAGASGTSGSLYIQDFQLEDGLVSTPYIATTTIAVSEGPVANMPRLNSVAGGCPSLLLEPQRTNLITQSEYIGSSYWDKKTSTVTGGHISPIGQLNAYKVVEGSLDGLQWIESSQVSTAAGDLTLSLYVKSAERTKIGIRDGISGAYATFDLSLGTVLDNSAGTDGGVESLPNGYYRLTLTITSGTSIFYALYILSDTYVSGAPSDHTYQGDGTSGIYIYGAQAEEGSYATSYIPTYGTATTRAGDSLLDGGNSDVFNDSEGVLFIKSSAIAADSTNKVITISDGTTANRVQIYYNSSNNIIGGVAGQASISYSGDITETTKIAFKYKANDFALWVNGVEIGTDNVGSAPSGLNQIDFHNGASGSPFYGNMKQLIYFNEALTDTELATLTTL